MFEGLSRLLEADRSRPESSLPKEFTVVYACPYCNTVWNTQILLCGNKLFSVPGIVCRTCGKGSLIGRNLSCVKKVFRIINLADQPKISSESLFVDAVSACAAVVIAADDVVLKEEVREFKDFCRSVFSNEKSFELAGDRLKFYLANLDKATASIEKLANLDATAKGAIFELLFCIAFADGSFDRREEEKITGLAKLIRMSEADLKSISDRFITSCQDEFAVLGIARTDDFNLIREAYRKKCLEFHPDRYQSLPESFQDFAKNQFQVVQKAYETLKKRYGTV